MFVPMTRSINLGYHVNSGVVLEKELDKICSVVITSIDKGINTTLQRKQQIILMYSIQSHYNKPHHRHQDPLLSLESR